MKIVYVRDCDRNPYGCVVEYDGIYGYSVCHPGETFKKAKAREIAIGRCSVRAMSKQEVIDAVPEYVKWAFEEVLTDIENYKNTRSDMPQLERVAASTCGSHVCCQPEKITTTVMQTPEVVRKTITKPANKSEGLLAMAKGWFSGAL